MKKVVLSMLLCTLLFGESEGFYKSKYEYLIEKNTQLSQKIKSNHDDYISAMSSSIQAIGTRYSKDAEDRQYKVEQEGKDLDKQKSDYEEKIMDLKFKMQDDLKVVPEWFTFKNK